MGRGAGVTDEGSGTTVTGVALGTISDEPAWIVFNIGDSRVYRLVGGVLEQLTVDHSIVQELVDAGQITREEADTHPHSNVITRAVGFLEAPIPDYRAIAVEEGMRLLVCSDGLTKELTSYGIRHFLTANQKADAAARQLVEAALGNGGRDNVTVVVVDVLRVVRPPGVNRLRSEELD
jgi:serine/threonine protein phosphatase PrpC